jgi:hypothetical protein
MDDLNPVSLIENDATGERFLLYSNKEGISVELRYEGDTLWLTQSQIADIFGVTRQTVNAHVNNIYADSELDSFSTCKEILQVQDEGARDVSRKLLIHNLDVIIAVGYRVNSKQGTMFRRWATEKLVQFATKGFVVDVRRLKGAGASDRIAELRDIVRDIRSDEANVYRELLQICTMCQDYDGTSPGWQTFFKNTQAKLVFAVTGETPSELVYNRVNAASPSLGLSTWPNENIRKSDVTISKNYLQEAEVKELNRLTTILLDIMEDQMDIGRLKLMNEASNLLDSQLHGLNRAVLTGGGKISTHAAQRRAGDEYDKYKLQMKELRHQHSDRTISSIREIRQALPKSK